MFKNVVFEKKTIIRPNGFPSSMKTLRAIRPSVVIAATFPPYLRDNAAKIAIGAI